ncbi:MAG: repeat protein [Acidimicrobiaceae bacterium]|nr:repeat protein [Acidimicrobiaceae bacterium]
MANLSVRQLSSGVIRVKGNRIAVAVVVLAVSALGVAGFVNHSAFAATPSFLSSLNAPSPIASTVPPNGDVNPYGIAVVTQSIGKLTKGDILVSNFNDKANVQGTGTTIVEVSPAGHVSTFAALTSLPPSDRCPGGVGLTTALDILPGGWVVVGSLPAGRASALPLVNPAGCLIVLHPSGVVAATWTNANINGPWDMTDVATSTGVDLFVANVLTRASAERATPKSGDQSTIVRIAVSLRAGATPKITKSVVIGSGFLSKANAAALVQGATGVALGADGTLYVAETVQNRIAEIPNATTRSRAFADGATTPSSGGWLNGPLGLTIAPNGDVIAMNANDGNAVEISPSGGQVAKSTLVPKGAGDLFGAVIASGGHGLLFVNDGTNALDIAKAM